MRIAAFCCLYGLLAARANAVQSSDEANPVGAASKPTNRKPVSLADSVALLNRLASKAYPSDADHLAMQQAAARLRKDYPSEPWTSYWQGELFERAGDEKGADQAWRKGLTGKSSEPGDAARLAQARCAERLGQAGLGANDLAAAERFARESIRLAPEEIQGYELLKETRLRLGSQADLAEVLGSAAERFGRNHPRIVALYLEVLAQLGEWKKIESVLATSIGDVRPTSGLARHYRARLAEIRGDGVTAFCQHFLAWQLGPLGENWTKRSRDVVRAPVASGGTNPSLLIQLANAVELADRPATTPEAIKKIAALPESSEEVAMVVLHLQGTCLARMGRFEESRSAWRKLLDRSVDYAPALASLAELEDADGHIQSADELLARAKSLSPDCMKVQEMTRLGGRFQAVDAGVLIRAVDAHSPLDELGPRPNDVVIGLDDRKLSELAPFERLRLTRLFQGGKIAYRTKEGAEIADEMALVLFPE